MTGEERASAALARVDALHTALTQIVLEGGNLDGIAAEVARVLGRRGRCSPPPTAASGPPPSTTGTATRSPSADLLDPTGRLRVERIGATACRVGGGEVRCLRVAAGGTDLARLVVPAAGRADRPPTTCTRWSGPPRWPRC